MEPALSFVYLPCICRSESFQFANHEIAWFIVKSAEPFNLSLSSYWGAYLHNHHVALCRYSKWSSSCIQSIEKCTENTYAYKWSLLIIYNSQQMILRIQRKFLSYVKLKPLRRLPGIGPDDIPIWLVDRWRFRNSSPKCSTVGLRNVDFLFLLSTKRPIIMIKYRLCR